MWEEGGCNGGWEGLRVTTMIAIDYSWLSGKWEESWVRQVTRCLKLWSSPMAKNPHFGRVATSDDTWNIRWSATGRVHQNYLTLVTTINFLRHAHSPITVLHATLHKLQTFWTEYLTLSEQITRHKTWLSTEKLMKAPTSNLRILLKLFKLKECWTY